MKSRYRSVRRSGSALLAFTLFFSSPVAGYAEDIGAAKARPVVTFALPASPDAPKPASDAPKPSSDPASPPQAEVPASPWSAQFELMADAIRIRWQPLPGAIRYHVEVSSDPLLSHRLWIGTLEATEALVPLHGFVPRGPVYVRFQAVNAQAEEVSAFITSSLLGRQTDLPGGISSLSVTTQPAQVTPSSPPPAPRRSIQWRPPLLSRNLTLISGRFGGQTYNNYLISHGLDWNGDSSSASLSSGARLFFSANDREGFSLNRGDLNLSTYLNIGWKHVPAYFSFNGYLYRYLGGGRTRMVNSFGGGYRPMDRLSVGAQFTPDPRYLSAWGNWALPGGGSLLLQLTGSDFSNAVTLTYQSQQVLR